MSIRLTAGKKIRTANRHFFDESGIRNNRPQKQHPFVVIRPSKTRINVDCVYTAEELLNLPDSTKVLAQWKGKTRSDFYRFSVKEFKSYISENPPTGRQKI